MKQTITSFGSWAPTKLLILISLLTQLSTNSFATVYTFNGNSGSPLPVYWSNTSLWQGSQYPGSTILSGDSVIIAGGNSFGGVVVDVNLTNSAGATILCLGTKTLIVGNALNPNKTFDNDGILSGTLNITVGQPTSTFNNYSSNCTINFLFIGNGTVNNYLGGNITSATGANIVSNATLNNYGYILFNGYVNFTSGVINNTFAMNFNSGAELFQSSTTITNSGSIVFQNGARWTLESSAPYVNTGQLKLLPGSTLRYNIGVNLDDLTIFNGANIISGNGSIINDSLTIQSNSTFWLGEGSLTDDTQVTIDGDFTSSGNVKMDWRGISFFPVYESPRMTVNGDAYLSGTLTINGLNGYMPNSSYGFLIMVADTVHGSFNNVVWPAGWTGQVYYNMPLDGWVTAFIQLAPTTPPVNDNICNAKNFGSLRYNIGDNSQNNIANPNMGATTGTTYASKAQPGETAPGASCSGTVSALKSVWYKFIAPQCGNIDLKISTNNATTNFNTILGLYTNVSADCSQPITQVACNDDASGATGGQSTLIIPAGTLTPGGTYWVQVSGVGNSSGNFEISIDADAPIISTGATTYGTIAVNLPTVGNQFSTKLRYRKQGLAGYADIYVTGQSSKTVTNLTSGDTYDFWAMYRCNPTGTEIYFSAPASASTLSGCGVGSISNGPTVTPVLNHCSLVTVSWPAHPGAQSPAAAYRVYWRQTSPTLQAGYCMATVNGTSLTLTFSNNLTPGATYDFWYTVTCTGGATTTSPITTYTACSGAPKPQADDNNQADQVYEKDGVYYVNMPFNYLNIPVSPDMEPGKVYTVNLNEVNNTEYFDVIRQSATAANENGIMRILPNPASQSTIVRYVLPNASEQLNIRILNIQGRQVYNHSVTNPNQIGDEMIDLSELSNGIYLINLQSAGFSSTQKLVVEK